MSVHLLKSTSKRNKLIIQKWHKHLLHTGILRFFLSFFATTNDTHIIVTTKRTTQLNRKFGTLKSIVFSMNISNLWVALHFFFVYVSFHVSVVNRFIYVKEKKNVGENIYNTDQCSLNLSAQLWGEWEKIVCSVWPKSKNKLNRSLQETRRKIHFNDEKNKDIVVQEKKKIRRLIHTDAEKSRILCHIMLEITLSIITLNKPILSRISTWLVL